MTPRGHRAQSFRLGFFIGAVARSDPVAWSSPADSASHRRGASPHGRMRMQYPTLKLNGEAVDLAHLKPIVRQVNLELRGGIRKLVPVEFRFSCHCFSRSLAPGECAPSGHAVADGSAHLPRPRVFDPERYALSKHLVHVLDRLIETNGRVSRTRHENFYRVEDPRVLVGGDHSARQYFVFFHARRVRCGNRPKSLLVWVESAYPARDGVPPPRSAGARSFAAALGESW